MKNSFTVTKCYDISNEKIGNSPFAVLLQDGRIITGCDDGKIKVFDPYNDFSNDITMEGHKEMWTDSLCQLDNGLIVSGGFDECLKFWKIEKKTYQLVSIIEKAHNGRIYLLIALSDARFILFSCDGTMKIWKNYKLIAKLDGKVNFGCAHLYIREKEILIVSSCENNILIFSMKTYQCITICENIFEMFEKFEANAFYQIDNERMMVFIFNAMFIVNISTMRIKYKIQNEEMKWTYPYLTLRNKSTVLGKINNEKLFLFDMFTYEYKLIEKKEIKNVNEIFAIDEHKLIAVNFDSKAQEIKY